MRNNNNKNALPVLGGLGLFGSVVFGLSTYSYTSTLEFNQARLLESRGQLEETQLPGDIAKREAYFQQKIQEKLRTLQNPTTASQRNSIYANLRQSLKVESSYQDAHREHCNFGQFKESLGCTRTQIDFERMINTGIDQFDPTGKPNIPVPLNKNLTN
jgi:hypothetical protein